jgi:putative oxidoreductase
MTGWHDFGKLLLRLTVGVLLLFHGVGKAIHGIGDIHGMIAAHHLPPWLAYGVFMGEVVGPILVILGLFARAGALLIAIDIVFAVWLAGMDSLFAINADGGYALELEAFFLLGALSILCLGAGRFSLGGAGGQLN